MTRHCEHCCDHCCDKIEVEIGPVGVAFMVVFCVLITVASVVPGFL